VNYPAAIKNALPAPLANVVRPVAVTVVEVDAVLTDEAPTVLPAVVEADD